MSKHGSCEAAPLLYLDASLFSQRKRYSSSYMYSGQIVAACSKPRDLISCIVLYALLCSTSTSPKMILQSGSSTLHLWTDCTLSDDPSDTRTINSQSHDNFSCSSSAITCGVVCVLNSHAALLCYLCLKVCQYIPVPHYNYLVYLL